MIIELDTLDQAGDVIATERVHTIDEALLAVPAPRTTTWDTLNLVADGRVVATRYWARVRTAAHAVRFEAMIPEERCELERKLAA